MQIMTIMASEVGITIMMVTTGGIDIIGTGIAIMMEIATTTETITVVMNIMEIMEDITVVVNITDSGP